MADAEDRESKTEDASPHKLEEARKKGDVAKSPDVPQWASLAGAFGVMAAAGGFLMQKTAAALTPFIAHAGDISMAGGGGQVVMRQAAGASAPIVLSVLGAAAAAGVAGNLIQHGFLWTPNRLAPDFGKLNPLQGLKRMFGVDGLVQFLKTVLKLICVGAVCFYVLKPHAPELANMAAMDPAAILPASGALLKALFFAVLALLGLTAGFDWFWQRYRFLLRMRMSREELKEEFKQQDGDPHVKAKLRQLRMQKSRQRMMQRVPKATVVVMNPTHYAVALFYEAGGSAAPTCVAKGLDALALKIRAVAEGAGVPVIEDPPLARSLYAAVEVDEAIPPHHYEAVAKIIGFIMSGGRAGQAGAAERPRARPMR